MSSESKTSFWVNVQRPIAKVTAASDWWERQMINVFVLSTFAAVGIAAYGIMQWVRI